MALAFTAMRHGVLGTVAVRPQSLPGASRCSQEFLRQLSTHTPRKPGNARLPGVIHEPSMDFEPRKTGFFAALDKLGNDAFMGEIFRGMWLSFEVGFRSR